jgi:hypothetical protein
MAVKVIRGFESNPRRSDSREVVWLSQNVCRTDRLPSGLGGFSLVVERRVCGQFDSRPTVAHSTGIDRRTRRGCSHVPSKEGGSAVRELGRPSATRRSDRPARLRPVGSRRPARSPVAGCLPASYTCGNGSEPRLSRAADATRKRSWAGQDAQISWAHRASSRSSRDPTVARPDNTPFSCGLTLSIRRWS